MSNRIKKAISDPALILLYMEKFHIYDWMPDEMYLKFKYRLKMHKKLNLEDPKTLNEKLQWLKLYDRRPEYTMMVDKYKVRRYIADTIGEEYLIPLLGVWDKPEDIDFDKLPDQFVLKCNHNSGTGMCICKDKSKLDIDKVRKELANGLKEDYYKTCREWPYKDVPRKIIAEKYMEDESGYELKDYKIFCFKGVPRIIEVDFDRFVGHKRNLYTTDWNQLELQIQYECHPEIKIEKPKHLKEMLELAQVLASDKPFVRTDFYSINERVYFGEITFFHDGGYGKFEPEEWDEWFGKLIKLPDNKR